MRESLKIICSNGEVKGVIGTDHVSFSLLNCETSIKVKLKPKDLHFMGQWCLDTASHLGEKIRKPQVDKTECCIHNFSFNGIGEVELLQDHALGLAKKIDLLAAACERKGFLTKEIKQILERKI